jgi:alpha-L-fucosidase
MFRGEKFDPDEWADIFKKTGARFVIEVAEHHDGFQMYDSAICKWNAKQMGTHRTRTHRETWRIETKFSKLSDGY